MQVKLEFSGGLEDLLPRGKRFQTLELATFNVLPICALVAYILENIIIQKPELFAYPIPNKEIASKPSESNSVGRSIHTASQLPLAAVRPGILVLVNGCDWEVEGGEDYIVQDGDTIGFISTLHGG